MAYITSNGLKVTLSAFLNNLISYLPIKFQKSMNSTLIVNNDGEMATGYYNDSEDDTLFSVGNGTETEKNNAFEVKKDGSVIIIKEGNKIKLQDISDHVEPIPVDKINGLN